MNLLFLPFLFFKKTISGTEAYGYKISINDASWEISQWHGFFPDEYSI
jgi:hypothetical protein